MVDERRRWSLSEPGMSQGSEVRPPPRLRPCPPPDRSVALPVVTELSEDAVDDELDTAMEQWKGKSPDRLTSSLEACVSVGLIVGEVQRSRRVRASASDSRAWSGCSSAELSAELDLRGDGDGDLGGVRGQLCGLEGATGHGVGLA